MIKPWEQTLKHYACDRCGYTTQQCTNHYGPTWSADHINTCPQCPPWAKYPEFGGQTTWTCIDQPESQHADHPSSHPRS